MSRRSATDIASANPLHAHTAETAEVAETVGLDKDREDSEELPEIPEPTATSGKEIVAGIRSLEDKQLNRRKLFFKLFAAWLVFFILVSAIAYFALPLLGVSLFVALLGPVIASLNPLVLGLIAIGCCAVASAALSSLVLLDKTLETNFSTNFNLYRWHQILPQIFSNAYRHSKTEGKISPWQSVNLLAHLHFIVGGLQLVVNKAFHQLYNKKVTYKSSGGAKEVNRKLVINWALILPRLVLAIPFLIVLLPLNLVGSFIEQLNYALYRQVWHWSDKKSFDSAERQGFFERLSPSQAAANAAVDWISGRTHHKGHPSNLPGFFTAPTSRGVQNPIHGKARASAAANSRPLDRSDSSGDLDVPIPPSAVQAPNPMAGLGVAKGSVVLAATNSMRH